MKMHSRILLAMAVTTVIIIQVHSNDEEKPPSTCPKSLWKIHFDNTFQEGEASVQFNIPPTKQNSKSRLEAFLACDDLIINGTGHRILQKNKKTAEFRFMLPLADNDQQFQTQEVLNTHNCTYELLHSKTNHIMRCQLSVGTLKQRILPRCSNQRGDDIISEIKVLKHQAQVQINFHNSPNDVVETEARCVGGSTGEDGEEESFILNPPGMQPSSLLMDFEPDCENHTVRKLYSHPNNSKCELQIFSKCQEGRVEVRNIQVEFDKDVMFCAPPKPLYIQAVEHLELQFRIESKPVVILLVILIVNGALYIFLIPFVGVAAIKAVCKNIKRLSRNRRQNKNVKPHIVTAQHETTGGLSDLEEQENSAATHANDVDNELVMNLDHGSTEGDEVIEIYDVPVNCLAEVVHVFDVAPITEQPTKSVSSLENDEGRPKQRKKTKHKSKEDLRKNKKTSSVGKNSPREQKKRKTKKRSSSSIESLLSTTTPLP